MSEIYTTALGAWGDSIVAYGYTCRLLDQMGEDSCNMIYYGLQECVVDFLEAQDRVEKVIYIDPGSRFNFIEIADATYRGRKDLSDIPHIACHLPKNTYETHSSYKNLSNNPNDVYADFQCKLPNGTYDFSKEIESFTKNSPYLLFQPFSINSVNIQHHWKYWMDALCWLVSETGWHVVLVGQENGNLVNPKFKFPAINLPRVLNLVGKTNSMAEVFAIAQNSTGVLSTTNALPFWCILNKIPCLTICNQIVNGFYYNWYKFNLKHLLECDTSFEEFKLGFKKWESTAMGNIRKIVEKKTVSTPEFNNRLTVELCENVHLHYRNVRLEFSKEEFLFILKNLKLVNEEEVRNFDYGDGKFKNLVFSNNLPDETEFNQRLQVEEQVEGHYHVHYRNLRLELNDLSEVGIKKKSLPVADDYYEFLKKNTVQKVEVKVVKLKDLLSIVYTGNGLDSQLLPIKETPIRKFLDGQVQEYVNYNEMLAKEVNKHHGHSVEKFKNLLNSIKEKGYKKDCLIACINDELIISDGQHRAAILHYLYGDECDVPILNLCIKEIEYNFAK